MVSGNVYFKVKHKFKGGKRTLKELRAHDARRHSRMLGAMDVPLGGNWRPSDTGLYFTRIGLGNPPKEYHVQLDTGSQVMWVNGASCDNCPKESQYGIKLNFYDANSSSTANLLTCDDNKCAMMCKLSLPYCNSRMLCEYHVTYGDGSLTSGYYVEDYIHFHKVYGHRQTTTGNNSIVFGCAAKQDGVITASDTALDGILGFGAANSSVLSQLAAAGKAKRMFSHCLDSVNGGGIFSIGQLVKPKLITTAPFIPNRPHYFILMKSIEVAGDVLELSTSSSRDGREAMVDSGTTLAHLPEDIYDLIVKKILSQKPDLQVHIVQEQFKCFHDSGNIDDGFPNIVLHFQNLLNLTIYPHNYLFSTGDGDNMWCIGWISSTRNSFLVLGDFLSSNKLVFYDVENQSVGWTDYNCSSSINVKDEESGEVYAVGAHHLSSSNPSVSDSLPRRILTRFSELYGVV